MKSEGACRGGDACARRQGSALVLHYEMWSRTGLDDSDDEPDPESDSELDSESGSGSAVEDREAVEAAVG